MSITKVRYVEINSVDFDSKIRLEYKQSYSTHLNDTVIIMLGENTIEIKKTDLDEALGAL